MSNGDKTTIYYCFAMHGPQFGVLNEHSEDGRCYNGHTNYPVIKVNSRKRTAKLTKTLRAMSPRQRGCVYRELRRYPTKVLLGSKSRLMREMRELGVERKRSITSRDRTDLL